jgi:Protein of unknown function (DUF2637)
VLKALQRLVASGGLESVTEHQVRQAMKVLEDEARQPTTSGHQPPATPPPAVEREPTSPSPHPRPVEPLATVGEPLVTPTTSPPPAVTSPPPGPAPGAKGWAWAGFIIGAVASIAANVLHTWLPAEHMAAGWSPALAPQIGAGFWPVGLLISVEVLSRSAHKNVWRRLPIYLGALTVAGGSAVISYGHIKDLLLAWGYNNLGAQVGPLVLDGLMVVCGFAMLEISGHQRNAKAGGAR